jgi:hypothetical protein
MEHKVYYRISIYKHLFNGDGSFDNNEEPVSVRVEDEIDMKIIVSAAVMACNQVVVQVEVE